MLHLKIDLQLNSREISRGDDIDYFIETNGYPINFNSSLPYLSRIQYPLSRAILVRTSPISSRVTIHILQDSDLYSSISNFELDLETAQLEIIQKEGYIELALREA